MEPVAGRQSEVLWLDAPPGAGRSMLRFCEKLSGIMEWKLCI